MYCINQTQVPLSGSPAGGYFTGPAVSGNNFNPSLAGIGTHKIKYHYTNTAGCSNVISQNVTVDGCALVSDFNSLQNIKITPNPNNGNFELALPESLGANSQVCVTNVLGEKKYILNNPSPSNNKITFSLNQTEPGIYFLNIISEGKQSVLKFVVN